MSNFRTALEIKQLDEQELGSSDGDNDMTRVVCEDVEDNTFRRWSLEEDKLLYDLHNEGKLEIRDIANVLKRGANGTRQRLARILDVDSNAYLRLFGVSTAAVAGTADGTNTSPDRLGLRPISAIISKLLYDPSLNCSEFTFVYEDRFDGDVQRRASDLNDSVKGKERLLIKAIPEHRIKRIIYKTRVVWCKETKLDLIFGSMNGHGTKLEEVIAGYDEWNAIEMAKKASVTFQIFCDLDGVLADFDTGVARLFGKGSAEVPKKQMWPRIASQKENGGFFASLPWMPNGQRLWHTISGLTPSPIILTGVPMGGWAPQQKIEWCKRELGPQVPVITCLSRDKYKYCKTASDDGESRIVSILIDDREDAREPWINAGGVFVHYADERLDEVVRELQHYLEALQPKEKVDCEVDGDL